jgi:hypothetical protein
MLIKTDITDNEPVELWRSPRIEGYCSETSVSAGERLKVMVSANPVSKFDLEIFRAGYYGGTGGRFMKRLKSIQGQTQPDPEIGENRLREYKWEPTVEFKIVDRKFNCSDLIRGVVDKASRMILGAMKSIDDDGDTVSLTDLPDGPGISHSYSSSKFARLSSPMH